MPQQLEDDKSKDPVGNYIMLNGVRRELIHHPADFAVMENPSVVSKQFGAAADSAVEQLAIGNSRVVLKDRDPKKRNDLMDVVRQSNVVAHHIYLIEGTNDEIAITDRLFVTVENDNQELLAAIQNQYELSPQGKRGRAYVFRVTDKTNANPIKIANEIPLRFEGVRSSVPEIFIPIQISQTDVSKRASETAAGLEGIKPSSLSSVAIPESKRAMAGTSGPVGPPDPQRLIAAKAGDAFASGVPDLPTLIHNHQLLPEQWHLTSGIIGAGDSTIKTAASISAFEAWQSKSSFGDSSIVIAIIDNSFDPPDQHPAFKGKVIDQHKFNYVENNDNPFQGQETHGTSVTSIATACNQMLGVAPGCAFLPIRLGLSPMIEPDVLLLALQRASEFADVVNCSFQHTPATVNYLAAHPSILDEVKVITKEGGRQKKGLVIVVSSGDFDSPISLSHEDNRDGIKVTAVDGLSPGEELVPANQEVHTSFPEIEDVVVVGATTSLLRKGVYSNWGKEVTVTAPSNNSIGFPGRKMLAATKHPGAGTDNPDTPFDDRFYTQQFGETSASAPIITGVVALMLSVNPRLSARQVIKILKSTADPDRLDPTLDSPINNLQGKFNGNFSDNHSLFFGAGKVNALKAVGQALTPPPDDDP